VGNGVAKGSLCALALARWPIFIFRLTDTPAAPVPPRSTPMATIRSNWTWPREGLTIDPVARLLGKTLLNPLLTTPLLLVLAYLSTAFSPLAFKQPRDSLIHFYQCDLSSSEAVNEVGARLRSEVGAPTALINNARLTQGFAGIEGSSADVGLTMQTNLVAPFLLLREFLPEMVRKSHGHIVNMSSMSALIPPAGLADYAASKAELVALHEVRDRAEDEDEVEHMPLTEN
jgi:all-trans-retinol dehydrogenase (NAD+)